MYFEAAEISLTDYCNRACSFCPQVMPEFHDLYKNKMMEFSTLENIKRDFEKFDKRPLIILAGFGEPLLYKRIDDVLDLFSEYEILMFTNMDNKKKIPDRENVMIIGNIYDRENETEYMSILNNLKHSRFSYIKHYEAEKDRYQNRAGLFPEYGKDWWKEQPCRLPTNNLYIDHLGNVLLCCNDWFRDNIFGNVNQKSLFEIIDERYISKAKAININRQNNEFCKDCTYKSGKSHKVYAEENINKVSKGIV